MIVKRLTAMGAADPTFGGGDGEAHTSGADGYANDLALQPDGRIVVAGAAPGASNSDGVVVRYTAAGNPDTSFGGAAGARVDLGGYENLMGVTLTPGGGVVATGYTDVGDDAIVVKLGADGTPDSAFGPAGWSSCRAGSSTARTSSSSPTGRSWSRRGWQDDAERSGLPVARRLLGPAASDGRARCQGKNATIVGTPGKDKITGTKKADVIVSLSGNDVVKGLGGNDVVCAGDGNDIVKGGPGKDNLRGEQGKDRLVGGTGKDKLAGGPQQDDVTQ